MKGTLTVIFLALFGCCADATSSQKITDVSFEQVLQAQFSPCLTSRVSCHWLCSSILTYFCFVDRRFISKWKTAVWAVFCRCVLTVVQKRFKTIGSNLLICIPMLSFSFSTTMIIISGRSICGSRLWGCVHREWDCFSHATMQVAFSVNALQHNTLTGFVDCRSNSITGSVNLRQGGLCSSPNGNDTSKAVVFLDPEHIFNRMDMATFLANSTSIMIALLEETIYASHVNYKVIACALLLWQLSSVSIFYRYSQSKIRSSHWTYPKWITRSNLLSCFLCGP